MGTLKETLVRRLPPDVTVALRQLRQRGRCKFAGKRIAAGRDGLKLQIDRKRKCINLSMKPDSGEVSITVSAPLEAANTILMPRATRFEQIVHSLDKASDEERYWIEGISGRGFFALRYFVGSLQQLAKWLLTSREIANFTYQLTARNRAYLAHTVSLVTGKPLEEIRGYIEEPEADCQLLQYLQGRIAEDHEQHDIDPVPHFGRRLGWYAVVRAIKPHRVIETGVDKGLGAVLLCAALARNANEGHRGEYIGTDINPRAGVLLGGPYNEYGRILCGDSIGSLSELSGTVDIFINDSDHSADYEVREYDVIEPKLSTFAIVLGDNAHVTDALQKFAERTDRSFLFFREDPLDHWYPGAGIGFAFPKRKSAAA